MIFLLYGDDLNASRQALLKIKGGYDPSEIFSLDDSKSLDELRNILSLTPFFAPEKLVVLEVPSEKSQLLNDDAFFTILGDKPLSSHVVVWLGGNLNSRSRIIKQLQELKAETRLFSGIPEKKVFPFLSALIRKQRARSFRELNALRLEGQNEHYLLTMIVWQLRQLMRFIDGNFKPSPFQRPDLEAARKTFSPSDVANLYLQVYLADLEGKTGRSDLALNIYWLVERITR